jgi:hypothetical protein
MLRPTNIPLTRSMQQLLNVVESTLSGFSSETGAGFLFMLSQLLKDVSVRASDVANWPNVSFSFRYPPSI